MADVALSTLRQYVTEELGRWREYTTDSAGDASGTYSVCAALDFKDNFLKGWYQKLTSGDTKVTRKLQSNTYPLGRLHPYVAYGAQIATSVTFELHEFDPEMIRQAINNAIRDLYPEFSKQIVNTHTIIAGNALPVATLDEWAATTVPDYHTKATTTASEETTITKFTDSCLKLGTAAGQVYVSSNDWPELLDLAGKSVDFHRYVYTTTSANARIYITDITLAGTTTTTNSADHAGGSNWEHLKVTRTLPRITAPTAASSSTTTDLAEVRFGMEIQKTTAGYFDKGYVPTTEKDLYLIPSNIDEVLWVNTCNEWNKFDDHARRRVEWKLENIGGTRYLWLKNATNAYKIELTGYGPHDKLTNETDTLPLDEDEIRGLVFMAVANLFRAVSNPLGTKDKDEAKTESERFEKKARDKAKNSDKRPPGQLMKNV